MTLTLPFEYDYKPTVGKGVKITLTIDEFWIPDAFVGTMVSPLEAVKNDHTSLENSAEDNLNTLHVVFAAYKSASENRSVHPSEIN